MPTMVILVLDNIDRLEGVLDAWWDAGVPGITILDSSGSAQYYRQRGARDDLPIFPSLSSLIGPQEVHNRTLFAVTPDEYQVERLFDATEAVLGSLELPHNGIMFALPVMHVRGRLRAAADG